MALLLSAPIQETRPRRIVRASRARKKDEEYLYKIIKEEMSPIVDKMVETGSEIDEQGYGAWSAGLKDNLQASIQKWADNINAQNRADTEKTLARVLGVDTATIMDDATVGKLIPALAEQAVDLIKNDLDDFKSSIKEAVLKNLQGIPFDGGRSLSEEIKHLAGTTMKRARLIARDQTHKINTGITQQRQQSLGIEEYIWRTSKDERVVGNPAGLYPKGNRAHGNHYERDGKKFRWDDPPFDGHPGYAINCRCTAEPVIDVEKLNLGSPLIQSPAPVKETYKDFEGVEYEKGEAVETTLFGKRLLQDKLSRNYSGEGWEIDNIYIEGETEKAWKLLVEMHSRYGDYEKSKVMFLPKRGGIHKMRTEEQKEADRKQYWERKTAEKQAEKEAELSSPAYQWALKWAKEAGVNIRKGTSLKTIHTKIRHAVSGMPYEQREAFWERQKIDAMTMEV